MSTQINVTVDSGGLRQLDKQNRQALRLGKLELDNQRKVEARATDQRTSELRKELLSAEGKPLYGNTGLRAVRKEEPAAYPLGSEEYFLLRPSSAPADGQVQLLSRKLPSLLSVQEGTPTFAATGGPSGAPALQAVAPETGANYVYLANQLPATGISKYADRALKDYTLQMFVRFGDTYATGQREVDFALELNGQSASGTATGSFRIAMSANLYTVGSNTTGYPASSFEFRESSTFTSTVTVYQANAVPLSSEDPKVGPGVWNHLALTRKSGTLRAFLGGQLLATATSTVPAEVYLKPFGNFVLLSFGQGQERVLPGQTVSIHGLRFDTKCLYTDSFTPPASL